MKTIALIDNEMYTNKNKSKKFPNFALMKISRYYKDRGYQVEWFNLLNQKNYELIFLSKVFAFTEFVPFYEYIDTTKLVVGGTGIDAKIKLDREIEKCQPDYSIYDVDYSIGFLTRGCNNKCGWCIVPEKEGRVHGVAKLHDILNNSDKSKKKAHEFKLLDNNILQYVAHMGVLQQLVRFSENYNSRFDFNQGLDIRLINKKNAELLSRIKWIKYLRFSCDQISQLEYFERNLTLLEESGVTESKFFIYLLVKDIDDAEKRVEFFRNKFPKVTIYAQVYRDFENKYISTQQNVILHKDMFIKVFGEVKLLKHMRNEFGRAYQKNR